MYSTVQRTNVNVTQHNVSRTERLKSTNSCPEKMRINSHFSLIMIFHSLIIKLSV